MKGIGIKIIKSPGYLAEPLPKKILNKHSLCMFMQEKGNIIDILKNARSAMERRDAVLMKHLSDRTIHTSSIYGDPDNVAVAVVIYALSKIVERGKYESYKSWPFFIDICLKGLTSSAEAIEREDIEGFRNAIASINKAISRISGHLKDYIEDVFRKASINKASRIYEHGISMKQTADLLGVTVFELAEYVGKTGIADVDLSITKDIRKRLKEAAEFFS